MCLEKYVPKKFLCCFRLEKGLSIFAIFMSIVMACCALGTGLEMLDYVGCLNCSRGMMRRAYTFSIMCVISCILMLCVHIWAFWGIKHYKSSVVLAWVLISAIWTLQAFILVIILLCLYIKDTSSIEWLLSLIFGLIAFVIPFYGLLAGYGYWLELKNTRESSETEAQAAGQHK